MSINYYTGYSSMVCHGSTWCLQFFKLAGTYPIHSLHAHYHLSLSIATLSVLLDLPYLIEIMKSILFWVC